MRSGLTWTARIFHVYPVLQPLFGKGLVLFHFAGIFCAIMILLAFTAEKGALYSFSRLVIASVFFILFSLRAVKEKFVSVWGPLQGAA
jgi:hypothetical protein